MLSEDTYDPNDCYSLSLIKLSSEAGGGQRSFGHYRRASEDPGSYHIKLNLNFNTILNGRTFSGVSLGLGNRLCRELALTRQT